MGMGRKRKDELEIKQPLEVWADGVWDSTL